MFEAGRWEAGAHVDGYGQQEELPEVVGVLELLVRCDLIYNRFHGRAGRDRGFARVLEQLARKGAQLVAGRALQEVGGGVA